jgi:hypothetical protein
LATGAVGVTTESLSPEEALVSTPETLRFHCSGLDDFIVTTHEFSATLPEDFRYRFRDIVKAYVINFGTEEAYERLNDRTLSQIFAEYHPEEREIVASGEIDGVRYTVYEAPAGPATDDENSPPK